MALTWNTTTLPFQSVMFARRSLSLSGGRTITGVEQVVQSVSDYWEAKVTTRVRTEAQRLYYRSLQAQNWGRAGEWIIPACAPFSIPESTAPPPDFSFSSAFSSAFALGSSAPPPLPPGVSAVVSVLAVTGARTLDVEMLQPDLIPIPGIYFSISDRLYLIGTVTVLAGVAKYRLTFAPGLRVGAPIATGMEFENPTCTMRLAQDNIGDMDLDLLRFADIQLNFVEVPA